MAISAQTCSRRAAAGHDGAMANVLKLRDFRLYWLGQTTSFSATSLLWWRCRGWCCGSPATHWRWARYWPWQAFPGPSSR